MRKLVISVSLIAGMIFGMGAGIAGGPNGSNHHGLCTAYFNGSQNGMDHKRKAGPFVALAQQAPDGPSDSDDVGGSVTDVWDWCNSAANPKGVGGNPTDPTDPNSTPPGGGGGGSTETGASNKGGKKK